MMIRLFVRQSLLTLCLFVIPAIVFAQEQPEAKETAIVEGRDGKDVIWLPTVQELVDKMLDLAKVTPEDYVIDLGSGDGCIVISAAKRGARALGIEYDPELVALSKRYAVREAVTHNVEFIQDDIFESDFSQATVLTLFLSEKINLRLRPKILDLKPGTRVVSNTFTMGDWTTDDTVAVEEGEKWKCNFFCTAHLWIVPAKVEGTWKLPQGQLTFKQSFQMISGTFTSDGNNVPIVNGRLRGDHISFTAENVKYTGIVNDNAINGTFRSGTTTGPWNAYRVVR
jgi:precorrin-6B methylase 2